MQVVDFRAGKVHAMATKKTKRKRTSSSKNTQGKKAKAKVAVQKSALKKKTLATKSRSKAARRKPHGHSDARELVSFGKRGMGSRSGGQSGDTQGLSAGPDVDSESVEELLEEGQSYEAEVIQGVEDAPDADQGEVRTREVEEDDVREEYREKD
jgi:hypothetical protein